MTILKKINDSFLKFLSILAVILLACILFTLTIQIIARDFLGKNFDSVIEINRIFFQWMVFIGAAYGIGKSSHIRFEILISKFNNKLVKYLVILCNLISIIFFITLIRFGYKVSVVASTNYFATIRISYTWLYAPVVIFGVLSVMFALNNILLIVTTKEVKK